MSNVLTRILATKAEEIEAGQAAAPLQEIKQQAQDMPPARGFAERLAERAASGPGVIAEVKKASPSKGVIRADFHPAAIARSYQQGGAACLSVLTDRQYFQGDNRYLQQARQACDLPVLRKDFICDEWQLYESRVLGADCILLIVAALTAQQLQQLDGRARELGLDVLVEVHDEAELEQALATGASLVGVNNRDLRDFTTDLAVSERLRPLIPDTRLMVTESGIHTTADVKRMQRSGISAFLVGEAFMRADEPGAALQNLFFPD